MASFTRTLIHTFCFCKNVLFGLLQNHLLKSNSVYLMNLLTHMSKYHIHCCKNDGKKMCCTAFNSMFKQHILPIKYSEKKALNIVETYCFVFKRTLTPLAYVTFSSSFLSSLSLLHSSQLIRPYKIAAFLHTSL